MKLTLTREQVPLARETAAWLRNPDANYYLHACESLPGFCEWDHSGRRPGGRQPGDHDRWADDLEAAITEAEGKDVDPRQPGPVSDADERALWRDAYLTGRAHAVTSMASTYQAVAAADEADMALDRYRKAFCAGMPSDQKGVER